MTEALHIAVYQYTARDEGPAARLEWVRAKGRDHAE